MRPIFTIDNFPQSLRGSALAIGKFDGVHKAHQALIQKACDLKGTKSAGVLTFSPHPSVLLHPETPLFLLTTDQQKARLLFDLGLDFLIIQPINSQFLQLSYHDFIESILVNKLGVSHVIVGHDFRFGRYAQGSVEDLERTSKNGSFKLHLVDDLNINKERCSSRFIRTCLQQGDLSKAKAMLGRPYSLFGRVSSGQGLGTGLGFATANINAPPGFALLQGIYATTTRVYSPEGHQDFLSATSVGIRPTVTDSKELVIETHLLDQKINLLNRDIEIFFIERLRDEQKFNSIDELKIQVDADFMHTRTLANNFPDRFRFVDFACT